MRYEEYTPTQIRWNHSYPSHWTCEKAKRFFTNPKKINRDNDESNILSLTLRGVIQNNGSKPIGLSPSDYATYQIFDANELVFKLIDLNNISTSRVGIVPERGIMSSAYIRFVPRTSLNIKYFYYQYFDWYKRLIFNGLGEGVRQTLSGNDLKNLEILVPPRAEQDQIVRYLDWQVSKINKLIAAKKTELDLLQEQEQAILDRVVTRGLHLGKSMRYSGINWIAEIPFDWETIKIRRFCTLQNGISESGDFFTKGTPFVSYGDVYKHIILPGQVSGVANSTIEQQDTFSVKKGDVFFTRTSETINEVGMPTVCLTTIDKAVFSGFLIRVRPFKSLLSPHYLKHYLRYSGIQLYFARTMNIVIRASLGQNLLKELTVLVPPKNEQILIAEYLDASHEQFENIRQKIHKEIDVLHELRTRLISDVVTGQIDVRNVNVPDFEMVEETISDESADEDDISEEAEEQEE